MTEIEIKAHVADPAATENIIRGFAAFDKETVKCDTYWKRETEKNDGQASVSPVGGKKKISQADANAQVHDGQTIAAAIATVLSFVFAVAAAVSVLAGANKKVAIGICLGGFAFTSILSLILKYGLGRSKKNVRNGSDQPIKIRIRDENGELFVTYKRKELQGDTEVNDEKEFSINDRSSFETLIADIGFKPYITKEKHTKTFSYHSPDGTEVSIELSLVAGLDWFVELEILADEPTPEQTERAQRTLRSVLALAGIPESAIETRYYTDMLREINAKER